MKLEEVEEVALELTAVGAVSLTGVSVASLAWVLLMFAGQLVTPPAFGQTRPAVELERAITQEQVDGDLKAAIAAYQKIAGDTSAPRDVRAKALLRLAGCYEKLGRQASEVYQQIVRDFADQPAAALARTRLAALKKEAAGGLPNLTMRKIETAGRYFGPPNTDGQRVVYWDNATGEVIYGDLAGRSKKVIFKSKPGEFLRFLPSRDFSMVAIIFVEKSNRLTNIAVVKTDGTGYRELVRNDEEGKKQVLEFDWLQNIAWSWDNRDLLLTVRPEPKNRSPLEQRMHGHIVVISVADGKCHRLIDVEDGTPKMGRYSPDGRFVAYDMWTRSGPALVIGTFVVPAAGGKPSLIHEESYGERLAFGLLDWTADGRYLAIDSSATGAPALHLFPVEDGQAAGPAILVRSGSFQDGVTTLAGALVCSLVRPLLPTMALASLGPDGRPGPWQRLDFGGRTLFGDPGYFAWSPDSSHILYGVRNDDLGQIGGSILRMRNLTTGQDREIHRSATGGSCVWGTQSSKLFCWEPFSRDSAASGTKLYSISLGAGAIEQLSTFPAYAAIVPASPAGRALYLLKSRAASGVRELLRWDIATGKETVLDRTSVLSLYRLSPDEGWLLRSTDLGLEVRLTSGGVWRLLVPVKKAGMGYMFRSFAFTPDSKWVGYWDWDESAGKGGLYRVPISGGAPERWGDCSERALGAIAISPDGRKISASSSSGFRPSESELWLLENFVPASPKR